MTVTIEIATSIGSNRADALSVDGRHLVRMLTLIVNARSLRMQRWRADPLQRNSDEKMGMMTTSSCEL